MIAVSLFSFNLTASAAEPVDNGDGTCTVEEGTILAELPVKNGSASSIPVGCDERLTFRIPEGGIANLILDLPEELEAPIQKEEVVGSFRVTLVDGTEYLAAIIALDAVSSTFPAWFSRYAVWICSVLMVLIVILVVYLYRKRRRSVNGRAW